MDTEYGQDLVSRSFDNVSKQVRYAAGDLISIHFGPRCEHQNPTCPICRRWRLLDQLLESPYGKGE